MVNNKILIVEDDAVISQLIEWRVKELGYRVCGTTDTGADAIALTKEHNPDVILMDISLRGDSDGIETARIIKQYFNTPIIFITASSEEKVIDRIISVKPAGYIIKPFTDDELRVALRLSLA